MTKAEQVRTSHSCSSILASLPSNGSTAPDNLPALALLQLTTEFRNSKVCFAGLPRVPANPRYHVLEP